MSGTFDALLDRHLRLHERVEQPNPEQARSEIETFVADVDKALESGALSGASVRQAAMFASSWRSYLRKGPVAPASAAVDSGKVPLSSILRAISPAQAWAIGGAVVAVVLGAATLGGYMVSVDDAKKVATAESQSSSEKARADALAPQLDAANKKVDLLASQVESYLQERLLVSLIAKALDRNRETAAVARKELVSRADEMQKTGRVNVVRNRNSTMIELKRTGEVWHIADR